MGFTDRFVRGRKSGSSSTSGNTVYNTSPAPSSAGDSTTTVDSLSARLVKTLTWGRQRSSDGNNSSKMPAPTTAPRPSAPKKSTATKKKVRQHPSERPLTEANLRHYEMLSGFKMEFGRTRSRTSFESDVSPMGSRLGSFDYGSVEEPFAVRDSERR